MIFTFKIKIKTTILEVPIAFISIMKCILINCAFYHFNKIITYKTMNSALLLLFLKTRQCGTGIVSFFGPSRYGDNAEYRPLNAPYDKLSPNRLGPVFPKEIRLNL